MPKKTRQEKIIADLRRKLETVKAPVEKNIEENRPSPRQPLNTSYSLPTASPVKQVSGQNEATSVILKDLRKTLILAGLAISFEVIVYLIWR